MALDTVHPPRNSNGKRSPQAHDSISEIRDLDPRNSGKMPAAMREDLRKSLLSHEESVVYIYKIDVGMDVKIERSLGPY